MIEEVKKIFDDIRDGIIEMGGDISVCTSPEEYAKAIKGLSGNNAVIFIPCFKASDIKPETPTKEMSPADPTDYPEGWGTPDGLTGKIWMTYTIVSVSTVYVPWTEPVLLGVAGESPMPPVYEPQVTRTFVICMELPEAEIIPNIPTGGKWDVDNNILLGTIEYPSAQYTIESILSNGNTAGWSCNNTHVSGGFTWMSIGTFLAEDGSQVGSWSDPMCINSARDGVDGHDGRNGVDGTDIEFIYMLLARDEDPASIPAPPSDPDRDDDVPITGHVPDWTDQPASIDPDNYPIEIMCQRKKNKETGKWGPFVGPVVWASWGEDGMDGDGIEYIFRVATNAEVTQDANGKYHLNDIGTWPPTCGDDCTNAFYTVAAGHGYTREQLTDMYQHDEWVPGDDAGNIGWDRNWTDDPRDVDTNEPFEFVSIRKYDGSTGTWGWFSEPVLWNKYYVSGSPIFTSFAFCRSTKNLGNLTLSGGTVINPLPDDQTFDGELIHWYDSIPGAEEYPNSTRAIAPIWMTSSKFGSTDPTAVIAANWSSPMLLADNKYFNVEYSDSNIDPSISGFRLPKFDETIGGSQPFIDLTNPEGIDELEWRQYCTQHGLGTWDDNTSNPKWMATCTFNEGAWSEWTITQVKGENGQNGTNGLNQATVTLYKSATSSPSVPSSATTYTFSSGVLSGTLDGWSQTMPSVSGSNVCWVTQANAVSSSATVSIATGDWSTPRQITGTRGPIGPKMRMRNWSDSYTNPDSEGMSGWQSGTNNSDSFYDIAIYPPVIEGINITNAASNVDRLWRCTQNIEYSSITAGSTPADYPQYFSQAVGWDFVATSLLLADKINANQIDVNGLSAKTIVTDTEDGSNIDIRGNTIELKKANATQCKISANPITVTVSSGDKEVLSNELGYRFSGGEFNQAITGLYPIGGSFIISETSPNQKDYVYSSTKQTIALEFIAKSKYTGNTANTSIGVMATLKAIPVGTGNTVTWYSTGYMSNLTIFTAGESLTSGDTVRKTLTFDLNTNIHSNFPVGQYNLQLEWTAVDQTNALATYVEDMEIYLSQYATSSLGLFSKILLKEYNASNEQYTDIGSDGFAHVLDATNYFYVKKNGLYLEMQFLTAGLIGLKIDTTGIYKTEDGGTTWTKL